MVFKKGKIIKVMGKSYYDYGIEFKKEKCFMNDVVLKGRVVYLFVMDRKCYLFRRLWLY